MTPFIQHVQNVADAPGRWPDEFLAWYKPDKWETENRAAAVFLGEKFAALQVEVERLRHWPQIANERAAEIIRLSDELERLRAQVAPAVPFERIADVESDEIADMRPGRAYRTGWNDCRAAMLAASPAAPAQQAEPVATGDVWLTHDDDLRFVARVLSGGLQAPKADIEAARQIVHGLRTTARAHAAPSLTVGDGARQFSDDAIRAGVRAFQSGHNGYDDLSDWRAFLQAVLAASAAQAQTTKEQQS